MTIAARFESRCPSCSQWIRPGTQVNWERGSKATHVVCPEPELEYVEQKSADQATIADAADRLLFEYEDGARLANLAALSKGIYRVSLNGREGRLGIDHINLVLVPNPAYGSVKISEYSGESVGRVDRSGAVHLWPDVDPKNIRTIAVLAALEIVLGSHDPKAYALAYARESETCWRCGADLLDEYSRAVLMGPDCFRAEYGMTQRQGIKAGLVEGVAPRAVAV